MAARTPDSPGPYTPSDGNEGGGLDPLDVLVGAGERGEVARSEVRIAPALTTLQRDQRALLEPREDDAGMFGLRTGFPSRAHVIGWYQRATVRTLGKLIDRLPPGRLVGDRTLLQALLERDRREVWAPPTDAVLGDGVAVQYRRRMEAETVQPAMQAGYNAMKESARDYVEAGVSDVPDRELDPRKQQYPAMRPGFRRLDRLQSAALAALWGGFQSRDQLLDWTHGLADATHGMIPEDLSSTLMADDEALRLLVDEPASATAREFRQVFAIRELLPAFADGVRSRDMNELARMHKPSTSGDGNIS